jgi:hypothetical protein
MPVIVAVASRGAGEEEPEVAGRFEQLAGRRKTQRKVTNQQTTTPHDLAPLGFLGSFVG